MGIAYCFHLIVAGCSDVDEVEIVINRFPSLNLIVEDYSEDWGRMNLFDSYHLRWKEIILVLFENYRLSLNFT